MGIPLSKFRYESHVDANRRNEVRIEIPPCENASHIILPVPRPPGKESKKIGVQFMTQ